ncbi:hypothetical protein N7499_000073 [Penicillium canescens]|nr:hypothetical protein N7499_000073 [Penicillium canescens]KAJ6172907.1 hypothetical protein N7485_005719 [Penicillium canescens]
MMDDGAPAYDPSGSTAPPMAHPPSSDTSGPPAAPLASRFLVPDPGTAAAGKYLPPPKARKGDAFLSPLPKDLVARPPRREPQLRESRRMTEPALRAHLFANIRNIEAALVVVGTVKETTDQECTHCKKLGGPWARCVIIEGIAGDGLPCANCHQLGRADSCELTGTAPPRYTRANRARFRTARPADNHPEVRAIADVNLAEQIRVLESSHRIQVVLIHEASRTVTDLLNVVRESFDLVIRGSNTNTIQDRDLQRHGENITLLIRAYQLECRQNDVERDMANQLRTLRSQL